MALSWALNHAATRADISSTRERCWLSTALQVQKAFREIDDQCRWHKDQLRRTSRTVGMFGALSAAVAQMEDGGEECARRLEEASRERMRPAARRVNKQTFRDWLRWTAWYHIRRWGRNATGFIAIALRRVASWLDDHTYGW